MKRLVASVGQILTASFEILIQEKYDRDQWLTDKLAHIRGARMIYSEDLLVNCALREYWEAVPNPLQLNCHYDAPGTGRAWLSMMAGRML
jgi:hypothetical protein